MKKIAWITDSTSSISPEIAKQYNITVLPLSITFGNDTYVDGKDITEEEFYEKLKQSKELPTTSQPAVGEVVKIYEELKKEYDMGIAVHVSGELSGTINSSKQAAKIAGFPVEVIDSKLISLPMFEMIMQGQEKIKNGESIEKVVDFLENAYQHNELYMIPGSLEQLHKGGRVSSVGFLIGSLVQITPVITLKNGKTDTVDKVRGKKKALKKLTQLLAEDAESGKSIQKVFLLHGDDDENLELLKQYIENMLPSAEIVIGNIGAVIGTHTGKGTIGITWFKK